MLPLLCAGIGREVSIPTHTHTHTHTHIFIPCALRGSPRGTDAQAGRVASLGKGRS